MYSIITVSNSLDNLCDTKTKAFNLLILRFEKRLDVNTEEIKSD